MCSEHQMQAWSRRGEKTASDGSLEVESKMTVRLLHVAALNQTCVL